MWGSRVFRAVSGAAPLVLATGCGPFWGNQNSSRCDDGTQQGEHASAERLRKRTTLQHAAQFPRRSTTTELGKLRAKQKEMLKRWEQDEDGWRELPARAWPAYQPDESQLEGIRAEATTKGCFQKSSTTETDSCRELLFNIATTLVFYNVDPEVGFQQYETLAKEGHIDSMVACGVILVEGLAISPREQEGIEWLRKAVNLNSSQACYELGAVYYTGIDGVVEEDPVTAFQLFERAAEQDHTAAMFMLADCLVEGEGTAKDVARAVPLLYRAADSGHRYARQRIRELLASKVYKP